MRRLIAAINMSLDGFCDHTVGIADDELHQHYNELLKNTGVLIYGRVVYQLMESYWPTVVENPTGNDATDEFAVLIQNVPKLVFSRTLTSVEWENTKLATRGVKEEVMELKQQQGKDVFVGSPSLIVTLMNLNLIDEFQLCIHPVVAGSGLPLFKGVDDMSVFKLKKTKTFNSGAVVHYYEPLKV